MGRNANSSPLEGGERMAKDLIDLITDSIVDAILDDAWLGRRGEKLTERELKKASARGCEGRVLRNAYIPKKNGETSEIDVLYLTEKGIFVIESKNYSGWIFGNEKDQKWTQSLPNGQKNRFYNPIRQNRGHIKWLRSYLGGDVPMFSIVVFSERCELKKITVTSDDVAVIKRPDLQKTIRQIWKSAPSCMDEQQLDELYEKLEPLTHAKRATKKAHVEDIRGQQEGRRRGAQAATSAVAEAAATAPGASTSGAPAAAQAASAPAAPSPDGPDSLICPRCGGRLVLRTAKRGKYAGNQFYGCSNYPNCHYIRNL